MEKTILLVLLSARNKQAVSVQKVLTLAGCLIKTRLGLHDATPRKCATTGLIILELIGARKDQDALAKKLGAIKGITVKLDRLRV